MKIVAIVGMTGAGKSEAASLFIENGFTKIRFGDVTDEEIKKRGLKLNEENERCIRELLRKEHGMSAYAILNLPKIDLALERSAVVIDGLYSWEEYTFLKSRYGRGFCVVAIWASPKTRYVRLATRAERSLTEEEAASRDKAEAEKLSKSGPIVMADFTILNEYSFKNLKKEVNRTISALKEKD
jgi:dephospho-CoA kinase|tara:strand:+ start:2733 stop:3284 length:552 start_codon:yes stop_codon:yes gene_type:complete